MFKYITILEDQTPRMTKLKSIYANTIGLDVDFNKDSILILNMEESVVKSFVKEFAEAGCRLPILSKLSIQEKKSNGYLKLFLSNCAPNKISKFSFEKLTNLGNIEIKEYLQNLVYFLPCVKDEILFEWVNLKSSTELNKIIKASNHCKRVIIRGGTVHTDTVCDFGTTLKYEPDYNIELISFAHGGMDSCEWQKSTFRFENIVSGIAKSKLKYSLKTIGINIFSIDENDAISVLSKHGLSHISIKTEIELSI